MKIGIVGTGMVGATAAFALVMRGVGEELVLIDRKPERARAEAADVLHATPFAYSLRIRAGDYPDLEGAALVIVAAGAPQEPGETRLDILEKNAPIFAEMVPAILKYAPETVIMVVSNPVDVMTHLVTIHAAALGVPSSRVIGSGTTLDTARFRALLGEAAGVDPRHVHAYVIGEHGDSEVLTWSLANIAGVPVDEFRRSDGAALGPSLHERIDDQVRNAAYAIIRGKGATYYGIGGAVAKLAEIITRNQRSIMTVSTLTQDVLGVKNVTLSLPRLLGANGVEATFPLPLNQAEETAMKKSAAVLRDAFARLE